MKESIPRVFKFQGFKTIDIREYLSKQKIEIILKPKGKARCYKCRSFLSSIKDQYYMHVKHLDIFINKCYVIFPRRKGHCPKCSKIRSEYVEFISECSPHITKDLAWAISKLCEICSVSNGARYTDIDKMLAYRVDYKFLKRMLAGFRIPRVTKLSVDEVYAKKKKERDETRDDLFFTIITDLRTHKVIYVIQSRKKEALDQFFTLLGKKACRRIRVVACDQHEGYKKSVEENCPRAIVVWDRFHLMQNFNKVLNEARKTLFENKAYPDEVRKASSWKI